MSQRKISSELPVSLPVSPVPVSPVNRNFFSTFQIYNTCCCYMQDTFTCITCEMMLQNKFAKKKKKKMSQRKMKKKKNLGKKKFG